MATTPAATNRAEISLTGFGKSKYLRTNSDYKPIPDYTSQLLGSPGPSSCSSSAKTASGLASSVLKVSRSRSHSGVVASTRSTGGVWTFTSIPTNTSKVIIASSAGLVNLIPHSGHDTNTVPPASSSDTMRVTRSKFSSTVPQRSQVVRISDMFELLFDVKSIGASSLVLAKQIPQSGYQQHIGVNAAKMSPSKARSNKRVDGRLLQCTPRTSWNACENSSLRLAS